MKKKQSRFGENFASIFATKKLHIPASRLLYSITRRWQSRWYSTRVANPAAGRGRGAGGGVEGECSLTRVSANALPHNIPKKKNTGLDFAWASVSIQARFDAQHRHISRPPGRGSLFASEIDQLGTAPMAIPSLYEGFEVSWHIKLHKIIRYIDRSR